MNMDRRNRKQEVIVKKVDVKIKDRGDLKKTDTKKTSDENAVRKKIFEDRGDSSSKSTNKKPNKTKPTTIADRKWTNQDAKIKNLFNTGVEKKDISKEKIEENPNIDIRKLIRERYTFKQKQLIDNPADNKHNKDNVKSDRTVNRSKKQLVVETKHTEKPNDPINVDITARKPLIETTLTRKPIIKTVTTKNGPTRALYKAVTFEEEKSQPKTLQINIPTENKMLKDTQKVSKSTDTVTINAKSSRAVKEKPVFRKKYYRKRIGNNHRHGSSPDSFKNKSPPTEVAKWAPCCVNGHTKPYYEAWINTTLAAISRSSKKDKMFLEKRSIIESFQRALEERAESPELIYERLKDENYTGRIRVIHK